MRFYEFRVVVFNRITKKVNDWKVRCSRQDEAFILVKEELSPEEKPVAVDRLDFVGIDRGWTVPVLYSPSSAESFPVAVS